MSACPPCFPWKDLTAQSLTVIPTLSSFFCLSSIFNLLFGCSYCGHCREWSPPSTTKAKVILTLILFGLLKNHILNTVTFWDFPLNSCKLRTALQTKSFLHHNVLYEVWMWMWMFGIPEGTVWLLDFTFKEEPLRWTHFEDSVTQ